MIMCSPCGEDSASRVPKDCPPGRNGSVFSRRRTMKKVNVLVLFLLCSVAPLRAEVKVSAAVKAQIEVLEEEREQQKTAVDEDYKDRIEALQAELKEKAPAEG